MGLTWPVLSSPKWVSGEPDSDDIRLEQITDSAFRVFRDDDVGECLKVSSPRRYRNFGTGLHISIRPSTS